MTRRVMFVGAVLVLFGSVSGHAQERAGSLTLAAAPSPCVQGTPNLAACLGPVATELGGLHQVACLLDALNRWRLQFIACTQKRVDEWQATVMWPLDGRRPIGAALARVRTLREEAEVLAESDWLLGPAQAALASTYTTPTRVDRDAYDASWGVSTGVDHDVQDLVAWNSAHSRNLIQGRTSAAFGEAGELPENSWERIGREAARVIGESETDPLAAIRYTPQLIADRLRVETSTTRLEAQALVTGQLQRDYRRLRREHEQHLGSLLLGTLTRRPGER